MRTGRGLLIAGALFVLCATVASCGSKNDSASTSNTTAAPGTTAVTGTTRAGGGKSTSQMSSDEIKQMQTQLNAVGWDAGPVDGIDGGETEAAIRNFQKSSNLPVDGQYGPQTQAALNSAVSSGQKVCTTPPPPPTTPTTTAGSSTTAGPTTTGQATTTTTAGGCPGPSCTTYTISPSSGPAGTTINVSSVSGVCTLLGYIGMNPTSPPGPSIATGQLVAEGMNQYKGTITVPAGTKAGAYVVQSWSTGAQQTAGICQQAFTVTG